MAHLEGTTFIARWGDMVIIDFWGEYSSSWETCSEPFVSAPTVSLACGKRVSVLPVVSFSNPSMSVTVSFSVTPSPSATLSFSPTWPLASVSSTAKAAFFLASSLACFSCFLLAISCWMSSSVSVSEESESENQVKCACIWSFCQNIPGWGGHSHRLCRH